MPQIKRHISPLFYSKYRRSRSGCRSNGQNKTKLSIFYTRYIKKDKQKHRTNCATKLYYTLKQKLENNN